MLGKKKKKERTEIKLILVSLFKGYLIQLLPNTEEVTSHCEHKKFHTLIEKDHLGDRSPEKDCC